jgi:hypothetical protein
VLASANPFWDETAAEFSHRLYAKLFDENEPQSVGDALLFTRREAAAAHEGKPFVWATTTLWGHPWVKELEELQQTLRSATASPSADCCLVSPVSV